MIPDRCRFDFHVEHLGCFTDVKFGRFPQDASLCPSCFLNAWALVTFVFCRVLTLIQQMIVS